MGTKDMKLSGFVDLIKADVTGDVRNRYGPSKGPFRAFKGLKKAKK